MSSFRDAHALRAAMAAALAKIEGLNVLAETPDESQILSPMAFVAPDEHSPSLPFFTTNETFGGGSCWHFVARVYVAIINVVDAQDALDAYLSLSGPQSVSAALEADPTLGGLCDSLSVTGVRHYGVYKVPPSENPYAGAEWTIEIYT